MQRQVVKVWTDGSCNNNSNSKSGGYGGWAFIVYVDDELFTENFGYEEKTTSTRMEMVAVLKALTYCKKDFKNCTIMIHSDSAMVVNCFIDKWYENWIAKEWYGVKNSDLWKKIIKIVKSDKNVTKFVKVKGHVGIPENERVDFLAGESRKFILEKNGIYG